MTLKRESRDLQNKWISPEMVHNQVSRIKEEDTLIGEDIAEGSARINHVPPATLGMVLFSRPNLPCSPLSGKTARSQGLALN